MFSALTAGTVIRYCDNLGHMSDLPPTVRPPSPGQIREIAEKHYLDLSDKEAEQFRKVIEQTLEVQEWIDEMYPRRTERPHTTRDPGYKPRASEDSHNAFVTKCKVEGADDGPLSGYSIGLKDNIAVGGIELTCGSKLLEGYVPSEDATVVKRLLEAGGSVTAKLNMTEFGVSHLSATGAISNPRDERYHAGSSSAGPAATVVNGDVDIAIGTDGGGSIRVPAAWSGCVGHHPTYGLVPDDGVVGGTVGTLSTVGPLARTVRDCALAIDVIADTNRTNRSIPTEFTNPTDVLDDGVDDITIGVVEEGFTEADPSVAEATSDAVDVLAHEGATVTELSIPWHSDAWYVQVALMIEETAGRARTEYVGHGTKGEYDVQLADTLGRARRAQADDLPVRLKFSILMGQYLSDEYYGRYYAKAQNLRTEVAEAYDDALVDVDVLVMPTTPKPAKKITEDDTKIEQQSLKPVVYSNTKPFNATGHPATSVPCGWTPDELPIGLMLVGARFDDATPLRVAHAYQSISDHDFVA